MNRRRRALLAAGVASLAGCGGARAPSIAVTGNATKSATGTPSHVTIDMHSHAGRVIAARPDVRQRPIEPVAAPMRAGGMDVICLAIVADNNVIHPTAAGTIEAFREPEPGELYARSQLAFARVQALIADQGLHVVTDVASLYRAPAVGPSVIITSEGADFLEGRLDRIDEAYSEHRLRQLQLTHYRVNELGDIQTAAPVRGGLTDFGADVIRRCNRLGIVIDVAHGTYELVKRAAEVSTAPMILSHTSLTTRPGARSRQISPDHARLVAAGGGVIGVWPPSTIYGDLPAMVVGIKRLADLVGVEHVGIGSDMLGLLSPSVFSSYQLLPDLRQALSAAGFGVDEINAVLGDNYARVFAAARQV